MDIEYFSGMFRLMPGACVPYLERLRGEVEREKFAHPWMWASR